VVPLQYAMAPGQGYVLAHDGIENDYYRAVTHNCSGAWTAPT
jgi:hypothetical protein